MESALVLCQSLFPCWDVFPFYRSQYYWPALTCWQPTTWTQALCFIFNNFIYFLKYKLLMQYKMFIFFFLNLYESRMAQQLHSQVKSNWIIDFGNHNGKLQFSLDWIGLNLKPSAINFPALSFWQCQFFPSPCLPLSSSLWFLNQTHVAS